MNHTTALITQIQHLLRELAGTVYSESQTVIEINHLIGKVRDFEAEREKVEYRMVKQLVEINEELTKLKYPQ